MGVESCPSHFFVSRKVRESLVSPPAEAAVSTAQAQFGWGGGDG